MNNIVNYNYDTTTNNENWDLHSLCINSYSRFRCSSSNLVIGMRSDKPSNSAIRQLYYDIPVDAYPYLAKELGYKRYHSIVDMLSNRRPMSMNFYARIQDAFKVYLAMVQFSTKNKDGIFDAIQTQAYYKGLIGLMNSSDYILLSPSKRTLILEEQKRIYKQLNR